MALTSNHPQTLPHAPVQHRSRPNGAALAFGGEPWGRGRISGDTPALRSVPGKPQPSRHALLGAFACGAIIPVFQPQVSLRGGALLGLEALARWRLPSGELAGPAGFFGAATRLGLIGLIDETILAGALGQLRSWRRAGLVVARVSVNLSAAALRDPGYPDLLSFHLDMHDLAPTDLAVEIVESVLIEDDEDVAIRNVRAMARAGIAVELDDFGSGHTSVTNLLRLDLQAIKLDRALVRRMGEDGRGEAVIRAVTTMTAELGLGTIAEGAESAVDVARLAALGCDAVQGYAIARPMTGEEAALWLAAGQDGSRLAEAGVRA